jgi:hypothetical protein
MQKANKYVGICILNRENLSKGSEYPVHMVIVTPIWQSVTNIYHPLLHLFGHHMDDVLCPSAASLVKLIDFCYDTCMDTKCIMEDSYQ